MKYAVEAENQIIFRFKKWASGILKKESGVALPLVLALFALGSLVIVPSLTFAASSLRTAMVFEQKAERLYTAESGIEDAIWQLLNDVPSSLPYNYEITNVNGLDVDVTIEGVTELFGQELILGGNHADWLVISKNVTYSNGIYDYTLYITNNGSGNFKIEQIVMDFPASLDFVDGSCGGDITSSDPTVSGNPGTGVTTVWDIPNPYPTVDVDATVQHTFQLSGPEGIEEVDGHGFVKATRDDVGTVWDGDLIPFVITAVAKDAEDNVLTTVKVGLWAGAGSVEIVTWQIIN